MQNVHSSLSQNDGVCHQATSRSINANGSSVATGDEVVDFDVFRVIRPISKVKNGIVPFICQFECTVNGLGNVIGATFLFVRDDGSFWYASHAFARKLELTTLDDDAAIERKNSIQLEISKRCLERVLSHTESNYQGFDEITMYLEDWEFEEWVAEVA